MKFGTGTGQIDVNFANRAGLFREVKARLQQRRGFALATLNLDHLTKLRSDRAFAAAYQAHDIVVADGQPIVWLSHLARDPVELMPGSDLILPICRLAVELDLPVALVGSSEDALRGASDVLKEHAPGLHIAFMHAPAYGFDPNGPEADAVLEGLQQIGAALCFIALGAPKQEIFAARGRSRAAQVGFLSIGAGLDFLSGHQVRAPRIMRRLMLEWLWRAVQSPYRMVPRYAKCFMILPGLAIRALRQR